MAKKDDKIAVNYAPGTLAFGDRTVKMQNNLFGLTKIPANKSYYSTAQTIVQTANGINMAVDINRLQCCLFADASANADVKKDFKSMEEFVQFLDIPQFFKPDKDGNVKFAKTTVSQMGAAGIVYNDEKAPETLKSRPWSVLGAMGSVIRNADERAILYEAINGGELTITTQDEARAYAKKRADARKRNKSSKDSESPKDGETAKDSEKTALFLLEICTDGVFHASYEADKGGLVTFGKSREEVEETLADMASVMVSEAYVTPAVAFLDGREYGAVVSTTGDATVYRLTAVEQRSINMPPASQIAGMREAQKVMKNAGMKVDPELEIIISIADMLNW